VFFTVTAVTNSNKGAINFWKYIRPTLYAKELKVKLKCDKQLTYYCKPNKLRDFSHVPVRHSKLDYATTCGELLLKVTTEHAINFVANLEYLAMKQGLSQTWTGFPKCIQI
jgi:hypothetical protein